MTERRRLSRLTPLPRTSRAQQEARRPQRRDHCQTSHPRSAPRIQHSHRVRQSGLDRTAVPERLAEGYRLRAGLAGSLRRRHGRRLRTGNAQRRLRQPAFSSRRRQCARRDLHRASQPDADGHHRRSTGAQHPAAAGVSLRRARVGIPPALRQVQRRAGTRRRCARRHRPRLLRRHAAALRTDLRFGADRRLDPRHAAGGTTPRHARQRTGPGCAAGAGDRAGQEQASRACRRPRRRSRRRRRPDGAGRRKGPRGGMGQPILGAMQFSGTPSAVRRFPARLARATLRRVARS